MNARYLIERIRALLSRRDAVPPSDVADLCDEAEAALDVIDRIAARDAERAFNREIES